MAIRCASKRVPLAMRVGVNTGEVVVRSIRKDDLHTDYVPVGHSTNLAARMEQLATPGSILMTDYTRKSSKGILSSKPWERRRSKGWKRHSTCTKSWRRSAPHAAASLGPPGPDALCRTAERTGANAAALAQAKAGHGQIVGVMGEPGLGKSRLFYEFKLLSQSGCLILEAYSVSYGKASPYLPLIELLKSYFQIAAAGR